MSIFSAKDFWTASIPVSPDEEFDSNSITIGNIDNDPNNSNKIIIGSMKGYLRIYEPHFNQSTASSLIYEKDYDEPILQVGIGQYILNSNDYQLAILQSKKFTVVQITDLHTTTNLKICYTHKLQRNGHNFTKGRIGDRNYDIVFIQSIDGAISIYEHDSMINIIQFSEIYFPGAIGYLNRKDSFIISNTAYEIECYDYSNIATIKRGQGDNKITYQWKGNIGELTKQIQVVVNSFTKKEEIVALSETLLNLLDDNGKVVYQKKLDYEPLAMHAYNICDSKYVCNKVFDLMVLVSTSSNHMMVYKGYSLVWTISVGDSPVFISLADFDHVKSLIVTLSDTGCISILYLGTETAKKIKVTSETSKSLTPEFMVKETKRMEKIIDNYSKGIVISADNTLSIDAEVNYCLHLDNDPSDQIFHKDTYGKIFRAEATLIFSYDGYLASDIRINIKTPYNVICDEPVFIITSLGKGDNTINKKLSFRVLKNLYPTSTTVDIYATYYIKTEGSSDKIFQSTNLSIDLPLALFLRISNENKKDISQNKITLITDKPPLGLNEIFKELTDDFVDSALVKSKPFFMTFIYPNKSEVSVIVSKQNGKYRIISNNKETLLFITKQVVEKLNEHFNNEISCHIDDPVSFEELMGHVKQHFHYIQLKKSYLADLEKYSMLYTNVQKSLLSKYKEKNPPELMSLDFLLKTVYKDINIKADELEMANRKIKSCYTNIIIWTELVCYLMKLRTKMSDNDYQILKSIFPLDNMYNNEFTWEEVTFANMANTYLLYFKKSKNLLETKTIDDLDKWTKYFITLFKDINAHGGFNSDQVINKA